MIDRNLPEPERRECVQCSRPCTSRDGALIHWPDETNTAATVPLPGSNLTSEPFSMWVYRCRWHRAAWTRRRNRGRRQEASP